MTPTPWGDAAPQPKLPVPDLRPDVCFNCLDEGPTVKLAMLVWDTTSWVAPLCPTCAGQLADYFPATTAEVRLRDVSS